MSILLLSTCVFVLAGMAPGAVLAQSSSPTSAVTAAPPAAPLPVAQESAGDIGDTWRRAVEALEASGYHSDALRIRRMLQIKTAFESPDARAERLLAANVHDLGTRVEILELAVDGYRSVHWDKNAAELDWFAAVGRAQRAGVPAKSQAPPQSAGETAESIMDRMVELILGASAVHHIRGHDRAADACMRLGRFYIERSLGKFAKPAPPGQGSEIGSGEALSEIGYAGQNEPPQEISTEPQPPLKPVAETLKSALERLHAANEVRQKAMAELKAREELKKSLSEEIKALQAERDRLSAQRALLTEQRATLEKAIERSKSEGGG